MRSRETSDKSSILKQAAVSTHQQEPAREMWPKMAAHRRVRYEDSGQSKNGVERQRKSLRCARNRWWVTEFPTMEQDANFLFNIKRECLKAQECLYGFLPYLTFYPNSKSIIDEIKLFLRSTTLITLCPTLLSQNA